MTRYTAFLASIALIVAGCSVQDETVAKQAGDKVGRAVTDFASGVGRGVDRQLEVKVELTKALEDQGVSKTVAKAAAPDPAGKRSVSVYLLTKQPLKGTLLAKALDKDGKEIGRATSEVDFAADDAKYVSFDFDQRMDSQLVDKYTLDLKPSQTP